MNYFSLVTYLLTYFLKIRVLNNSNDSALLFKSLMSLMGEV